MNTEELNDLIADEAHQIYQALAHEDPIKLIVWLHARTIVHSTLLALELQETLMADIATAKTDAAAYIAATTAELAAKDATIADLNTHVTELEAAAALPEQDAADFLENQVVAPLQAAGVVLPVVDPAQSDPVPGDVPPA